MNHRTNPTASTIALAAYILAIVSANAAIAMFGIIPIGFGLMAPAGVLFAGLTFTIRDAVQEYAGRRGAIAAIVAGAAISAYMSPGLALASGAAFLISEAIDLAIYTPLRQRNKIAAVLLSNTAGAIVDSALFLWLAFGSLDYIAGQIAGKTYMTGLAVLALWGWNYARQTRRRAA